MTQAVRDLKYFFSPRSIAIIGASGNFGSISGKPLRYLKQHGYQGKIFPVNPRSEVRNCGFPKQTFAPETGSSEPASRTTPSATVSQPGASTSPDPSGASRQRATSRSGKTGMQRFSARFH